MFTLEESGLLRRMLRTSLVLGIGALLLLLYLLIHYL